MATNFDAELGVDISCVLDLDPSMVLLDTTSTLGQACARRLITPRGGLFYDREYGNDLRVFLKRTGYSAAQIARFVEAELLKDERVENVAADVEYDDNTEALSVDIRVRAVTGKEFDLTLNVSSLTVELLSEDVTL